MAQRFGTVRRRAGSPSRRRSSRYSQLSTQPAPQTPASGSGAAKSAPIAAASAVNWIAIDSASQGWSGEAMGFSVTSRAAQPVDLKTS